jgi:hypothetical protein
MMAEPPVPENGKLAGTVKAVTKLSPLYLSGRGTSRNLSPLPGSRATVRPRIQDS